MENNRNLKITISFVIGIFLIFKMVKLVNNWTANSTSDPIHFYSTEEYDIIKTLTPSIDDYTQISNSEFPDEAIRIAQLWSNFNDSNIETIDKIELVSSSYIQECRRSFYLALYQQKNETNALNPLEKLHIYSTRLEIHKIFSGENLKTIDDNELFYEYIFIKLSLFNFSALENIKFENEAKAYGLFNIMGAKKCVEFIKNDDKWTLDFFEEEKLFKQSRLDLVNMMIKQVGHEQVYFEQKFIDFPKYKYPLK